VKCKIPPSSATGYNDNTFLIPVSCALLNPDLYLSLIKTNVTLKMLFRYPHRTTVGPSQHFLLQRRVISNSTLTYLPWRIGRRGWMQPAHL